MTLFSHLTTLTALALIALSAVPVHANLAHHGHGNVAKHRRDASSPTTCKPRPTTSPTSAAPTTTPPTPTSATSAPSPTSSGTKRMCLAWGTSNDYLPNFARPNVAAYYSWSADVPTEQLAGLGIEGMVMLWGPDNTTDFQQKAVEGYASYALGFNEPDQKHQANIGPNESVSYWMQYIQPLKNKGYQLATPACTDSPGGLAWYQTFMNACWSQGCTFDYLAVHTYNTDVPTIIAFVTNLHKLFGLPIMITEFADQDFTGANQQATMDQVGDFATAMIAFIDETDWIHMACPYGIMDNLNDVNPDNALLNLTNDYPTSLGYKYFG